MVFKLIVVTSVALVLTAFLHTRANRPAVYGSNLDHARTLMKKTPMIDTHNDWPLAIEIYFKGQVFSPEVDLTRLPSKFMTDIERLREGQVGAQFWSAYVPCSNNLTKPSEDVSFTLHQIDLIKRVVTAYPKTFGFAKTVKEIRQIFASGRIASLIGVEGGHSINNDISVLRLYFELGVRYMTLTHGCNTLWAECAQGPYVYTNGLTPFGDSIIREMNRLGMMVDVSHVSPKVMHRVLDITKAPVLFSHSSARAMCDHVRNVPDDVLLRLPSRDGVVMINYAPDFVCADAEGRVTLSRVADHIEHIRNLIGARYIGIGADYDGIDSIPEGLEDVSTYPQLMAELLRRGFSDGEVSGIIGGNLLRVMGGVERAAAKLQREVVKPVEERLDVIKAC